MSEVLTSFHFMNSFHSVIKQEVACPTSLPLASAFDDLVDEGLDLVSEGRGRSTGPAHLTLLPMPLALQGLLDHLNTQLVL